MLLTVAILSLVTVFVVLKLALRPLDDMEQQAINISRRQFTLLPKLPWARELHRVANAMNAMVVSVLERRSEIGLRRALGATRTVVGALVLVESTALCTLGAVAGAAAGMAVTWAYAAGQGIAVVIPPAPVGLGLVASVVVGVAAGLYPALRAARLAPATALRTTG